MAKIRIPESCEHGWSGTIVGRHDEITLVCCNKCNQMYFTDTPIFEMFMTDLERKYYGQLAIDPSLLA